MQPLQLFATEVPRVMPYTWPHPQALAVLGNLSDIPDRSVEQFQQLASAHAEGRGPRLSALLRKANYRLRRIWRALQALPSLPARVWLDVLRMA